MAEVKGLTTKEKQQVKAALKEDALKQTSATPEETKKLADMLELAKMPIVIKDKDIKLGPGEVDFRQVSDLNARQLLFRYLTLNNVYLKDIRDSLIDIQKLLMILAKTQGVTDIIKATDEIVEELRKETEKKFN